MYINLLNNKEIKKYKAKHSHPLHSSTKPGVLCVDIHPYFEDLIVSGGVDGKAVVFNVKSGKVIESVEKHTKRINAVQFMPDESLLAFATASADNFGSFFILNNDKTEEPITERYRIQNHTKSITSLSFHPLREYALFGSLDGTWSYHNILRVKIKFNK